MPANPSMLIWISTLHNKFVRGLDPFTGIGPLLLRLFLAMVMIQAGWTKLIGFENTAAWFGNPDWGLGMPFPYLMAALAAGFEFVGGLALVVGFAVRWFAIPLALTMLVAMTTVHWENGWLAIADGSSWLANERVDEAVERKEKMVAILRKHGDYKYLTAKGSVAVLNNGIEFGATYFVMLLSLLFTGAGKYTSIDDLLKRRMLHTTT